MTFHKQVCVIGAGSSGITAIKSLKDQGISFDCYEKGSEIGGNWRYNNDNGMSSAYKSLHINTNRNIMAYADYPMPADYPMFPHHSHIIKYFDAFVDKFDLRKYIHFNTEVIDVQILGENEFVVETSKGKFNYEHVIIANGHHWNPRYPEPAFDGNFTGEIAHSHDYKTSKQIEGKNVLIVGIGNSAVDIACEAARLHSGKVTISSRSGAHIVPNWVWSKPLDSLANPITAMLPLSLQRILLSTILYFARGNQEDFGVPKPKRPLLKEHPTLSQDLLNLSGRGLINYKPNIQRFDKKTVWFDDGSFEDYDIIIYATGYKITFPFLKNEMFSNISEKNDIRLYNKIIHPDYKGLYFLALIQPLGAIMPLAEVQGKYIAKIISGKKSLPSVEQMLKSIEKDKAEMIRRYGDSPRHTIQVDFHNYKNLILRAMG